MQLPVSDQLADGSRGAELPADPAGAVGGTLNELNTHSCSTGRSDSCHLPLGCWERKRGKP